MSGRARLSPYYFVTGEKTELAGILATDLPGGKKVDPRNERRGHGALRGCGNASSEC